MIRGYRETLGTTDRPTVPPEYAGSEETRVRYMIFASMRDAKAKTLALLGGRSGLARLGPDEQAILQTLLDAYHEAASILQQVLDSPDPEAALRAHQDRLGELNGTISVIYHGASHGRWPAEIIADLEQAD